MSNVSIENEQARLWNSLDDERISRIAGDEANSQSLQQNVSALLSNESRLSTEVVQREEGDLRNINSLTELAKALSDYRIKTDLEINNEKIVREQLGIDLDSKIDTYTSTFDHKFYLVHQRITDYSNQNDQKLSLFDERIKKYEEMLQDITTDSIQITMDNGEINMGAWTILSQAREWDLEILRGFKGFTAETEQKIDEALEDFQNKLPIEQVIIDKAIEALSDSKVIKDLDAAIKDNGIKVAEVNEALITESQRISNEIINMSQAKTNELNAAVGEVNSRINQEVSDRIDAVKRESEIRQQQLLNEAAERSAEIDERIRDIEAGTGADLTEVNRRIDDANLYIETVKSGLDTERTERLADVATLNNGLTSEVQSRKDGDTAITTSLNNYKASNDVVMGNFRDQLEVVASSNEATVSRVEALDATLKTTNDKLDTTTQTAATALERANTAVTENEALSQRVTQTEAGLETVTQGLATKAEASVVEAVEAKVEQIDGEVKTTTSNVSQMRSELDVVKNDLPNKVDASVLTAYSTTAQTNKAIADSVTAYDAGLVIGSQNLLSNGDVVTDFVKTGTATVSHTTDAALRTRVVNVTWGSGTAAQGVNTYSYLTRIKAGRKYTLSFLAKASAQIVLNYIYLIMSGGNQNQKLPDVTIKAGSYQRYSITFTASNTNLFALSIATSGKTVTGQTLQIAELMIQEGTKSTEWQVPITTIEGGISANATAIQGVSTKVTNLEGVTSSNSTSITNLENQVSKNTQDISSKASSQAVNDLSSKVEANENKITSITTDVTTLKNDVTVIKGDMQGMATSAAVQALDSRVTTTEGSISSQQSAITKLQGDLTATNGELQNKASSQAVSALDQRVTATEGSISAQGTSITELQQSLNTTNENVSKKADSSYVQTIDNRVTTAEGKISSNTSEVTALKNSLDNLSIGGRNLVKDTAKPALSSSNTGTNRTSTLYYMINTWIGLFNYGYAKLCVSFDWKYVGSNPSGTFRLQQNGAPYASLCSTITVSANNTSGKHRNYLMTPASNWPDVTSIAIRRDNMDGAIEISNFKIESGTKSTEWTPAPEDFQIQISANSSAINTLDSKVQQHDNDIVSQSGQILNLNNSINSINSTLNTKADSSALSTLDSRVQSVEGKVESQSTQLVNLNNSITDINSNLSTKADSSAVSLLSSKVENLDGKVNTLSQDVVSLNNSLTDTKQNVAANSAAMQVLSSRVTTNEEAISTKAEAAAVTNLQAQVNQNKADAALTYVTKADNEQSEAVLSNNITAAYKAADANVINTAAYDATVKANQAYNDSKAYVEQYAYSKANSDQAVAGAINNYNALLVIGANNLFTGTQEWLGNWTNLWAYEKTNEYFKGLRVLRTASNWTGIRQDIEYDADVQYTLSAWVKKNQDDVAIHFWGDNLTGDSGAGTQKPMEPGVWTRVTHTFKGTGQVGTARFEKIDNGSTGSYDICGLKVERGNKATDWSPNPKDEVNALVLGGRNLFTKSTQLQPIQGASNAYRENNGFVVSGVGENNAVIRLWKIDMPAGICTVSFDHKIDVGSFPMQIGANDGPRTDFIAESSKGWQHFELQVVVTSAQTEGWIDIFGLTGQPHVFNNFKVERGSKATDYTPAPEDVASDINKVQANLSNFQEAQATVDLAQTNRLNAAESQLGANAARINNIEQTYATKNSVGALARNELESEWQTYANNVGFDAQRDLNTYKSEAATIYSTKAEANSTSADLINRINSKANQSGLDALSAEVTNNHYTRAQTDQVVAGTVNNYKAELGNIVNYTVVSRGNESGGGGFGQLLNAQGNSIFNGGRSYSLVVFNASGTVNWTKTYDIYENNDHRNYFYDDVNNLPNGVYVAIFTSDEPNNGRDDRLFNALRMLGGTREVNDKVPYRGEYMLIGCKGMTESSAVELVAPAGQTITYGLQFVNGVPVGIGSTAMAMPSQFASASAVQNIQTEVSNINGQVSSQAYAITELRSDLDKVGSAGPNLLKNSDFSNKNTANWGWDGTNSVYVANDLNWEYALSSAGDSRYVVVQGGQAVELYQFVPVEPNKIYQVSAHVASHRSSVKIYVSWWGKDMSYLGYTGDNVAEWSKNGDGAPQAVGGPNGLVGTRRIYQNNIAHPNAYYMKVTLGRTAGDDPYMWATRLNAVEINSLTTPIIPWGESGVGLGVKLTETAQVVDGVKAVRTTSIDNNGFISGYGLISELVNGVVQSAFGVNADYFFVGNNNDNKKKPFMVLTSPQTINGVTYPAGTWMDVALIANATIGTAHIADASITNAKIANVDAAKITTGYLNADRIEANSISAAKMMLQDTTNLWGNRYFDNKSLKVDNAPFSSNPGYIGNAIFCERRDHIGEWASRYPVRKGDVIVTEFTARAYKGSGRDLNAGVWVSKSDGSTTEFLYTNPEWLGTVSGSWNRYRTTVTIGNSESAYARLFFQIEQAGDGSGAFGYDVCDVVQRRAMGGELLVDGSITANKINADAIDAISIQAREWTVVAPNGTIVKQQGSLYEVRNSSNNLLVRMGEW